MAENEDGNKEANSVPKVVTEKVKLDLHVRFYGSEASRIEAMAKELNIEVSQFAKVCCLMASRLRESRIYEMVELFKRLKPERAEISEAISRAGLP